ncbi:MAG: glycoside hydrolase family 71/99-like protein [Rubripirellula sp.]
MPLANYILAILLALLSTPLLAQQQRSTTLVHYMPWYSTKSVSGAWGWHWTMGRFDPEKVDSDGQREIASQDYPLIGPYDSNDPDALECHVLLIKFSGIDGVIIDWYGTTDLLDYGSIHRNTKHLIQFAKRAGLKFAICYEDATIQQMIQRDVIEPQQAVSQAQQTIRWVDENWMSDPNYVQMDGDPILLVFGPRHFVKPADWRQILSPSKHSIRLFCLPHLAKESGAGGVFGWPPVSGGKTISPADWQRYIAQLGRDHETVIAPVFPKFHDVYQQAGLHDSYGYLDDQSGKTFDQTLKLAHASDSALIQIATWNDYGEGTMIEPTVAHRYRYLELLQKRSDNGLDTSDLRLPVQLYQLRKKHSGNAKVSAKLDAAAELLFNAKCDQAKNLLLSIE